MLVDPRDPNVCYVGETEKDPVLRMFQHMADAFELGEIVRNAPKQAWLRDIWYHSEQQVPNIVVLEQRVAEKSQRMLLESKHIRESKAAGKTVMNADLSSLAFEAQNRPEVMEKHRERQRVIQNHPDIAARKSASMKAHWAKKRDQK